LKDKDKDKDKALAKEDKACKTKTSIKDSYYTKMKTVIDKDKVTDKALKD
jgi:hypothetical protein